MSSIEANNPNLKSWVEVQPDSDFPIQNLPFGIFSHKGGTARIGVAIGDAVLDLSILSEEGFFDNTAISDTSVFFEGELNHFIALGKPTWRAVRQRVSELLQQENQELQGNTAVKEKALKLQSVVQMHLPVKVGDYTDFYSSLEHATNVGSMFRDPKNALLPNWKHLPVGYHGRASSIIVSGTNIHRPKGQSIPNPEQAPIFGSSQRMDFELEMAFITGGNTTLGESITTEQVEDYIFGFVIFNDWSARDIQKWEYQPLGPFLAKSFASSISPWVVTKDALEPFRVPTPTQEPAVLPYLQFEGNKNFDINLEVFIQPEGSEEKLVCQSNSKYLYWNVNQQLAHQTVNGCPIKVGDIYASGTISGPTPDSYGSMLELTWAGKNPIPMPDGTERKFLLDKDTVIMKGYAQNEKVRVGFGEVRSQLLPVK